MPTRRARKKAFGFRFFSLFSLSAFPIWISELGPVQTGRPSPGREADGSSESLPVFNTRRESGNGTREFAIGTRNRAPAIQLPPGNHSVSGLSCFWRRRYCSKQTTLGDRNQRYSPLQGWEVYLARSSSGMVHSRRKESSRF